MEILEQKLFTDKQFTPIFQDTCAEIYHLAEGNVVCVKMRGLTKNQCYQLNAERALVALQRYKSAKMLIDFRNLVMMTPEDQQWTTDFWQKQAEKVGLKLMAIIAPDNLFAALIINKLVENIKRNASFENFNFSDEVEAYQWLIE
jgi:hypothetical protein